MSKPDREAKLDRDQALSIRRQCPLLSLSRLGGVPLIRRLDAIRRLAADDCDAAGGGLRINCKRVQRLMHGDKASDWEARWP